MLKEEQRQDLNSMIKTSGFAGAGKLVDIFLRYSTSVALTRILGANLYGLFVLGRAITWIVSTTGQMGMGIGVVREIAFHSAKNDENKYQQTIRLALLVCSSISIIAAAVMYWKVDYISMVLFKKPGLAIPLKLLIITIPIISISYLLLDVLRGFKRIKAIVLVEYYFLPLANLFMILVLYFLGYRLEGVIAAFILANLFTLIILIMINRGKIKIAGSPFLEKKITVDFFKFSVPLVFAKILAVLKNRLDIVLLGFLSTASNTGIFFIALRLANLLSIPWQATNMIFAPTVSGHYAQDEIKKIEYNYKNITKMMFLFSIFFWGFLFIFSRELLSIFGDEFEKAAPVVILVCFGQLVKTLVGHAGPILVMIGKTVINLLITIITLVLLIVLNLLLIPKLGIMGAGIANLTTLIISSLLELYFIYYYLHIHPFKKDFIKPVIAISVSTMGVCLLKEIFTANVFSTLLSILTFAALYLAILYLQGFSREEMELITAVKNKVMGWKRKND